MYFAAIAFGWQLISVGGSMVGGAKELAMTQTGTIRVSIAHPAGVHFRLFAAKLESQPQAIPLDWNLGEDADGTDEKGRPWTRFRLPPGRFAILIDQGPEAPPFGASVEVFAGGETPVNATPLESRPLSVRILASGKLPVAGARVVRPSNSGPERALSLLLSYRSQLSKEDGLLKFGPVPAGAPLLLRVAAPGFRIGTLKLGAGFEAGQRDLSLFPNQDVQVQVSGLERRRGEAAAEVTLSRCRIQATGPNCNPAPGISRPLDENGRALFNRIEGGHYQVSLAAAGLGTTRQAVEVSSEGDSPLFLVEMAVGEWTIRGSTRLHDGTPQPAAVRAIEFVDGVGRDAGGGVSATADGSFELKVISRAGNGIALRAESEKPRAVAAPTAPIRLDDSLRVIDGVVVELDATAIEIAVSDARTSEPLSKCPVRIEWQKSGDTSFRSSDAETDEQGLVRLDALSGGVVRGRVRCRGHYARDLEEIAVDRDLTKRIEVVLDASQDVVLEVVGEGGRPVGGANILALVDPLRTYFGVGQVGNVARVGTTDNRGELVLSGDRYGGVPVFVVASASAIAQVLPPTPQACASAEDCRVKVTLRPLSAFGGLTVRNESGDPVSADELTFVRGGVPFPYPIRSAALAANGLPPDAAGASLDVRAAALLPDGAYSAIMPRASIDPSTGNEVWKPVLIGTFVVPSLERAALINQDRKRKSP